MSDLLDDTSRHKRRQSAIQLRRLSTPPAAAYEQQIIIAAEEAIRFSRACYRITFFLAALNFGKTFMEDKIWSKLFDANQPNLGWADYVEIFDSTTLLISGLSMWHGATCHEQNKTNEKDEAEKLDDTSYFFTIMYWVWGIAALNLALVSLSIASALPTIGFEGPFHSKLIGAESTLTMIVVTIIAVGYSIIKAYCARAAMAANERDNERINQCQRDSKNRAHFKRIRKVGHGTYCSIMLCAGSSLLYSFMEFSKWVVADKEFIARCLTLFDLVDPFSVTILITKLSGAFLGLIPIHREWSKESHAQDSQICIDYFNAYASFYKKRTNVLKGIVFARVSESAAPYIIPYASIALRNVAPTLHERVFG